MGGASYNPIRDSRFEYVSEAIDFIEVRQCKTCRFREEDTEMPMCIEISASLLLETPHPSVVDYGNEGIACKRWQFKE